MIDFGIRTVIAASFAPAFEAGCYKHGILPVTLPESEVQKLGEAAENKVLVTVDLDRQTVSTDDGYTTKFKTDSFQRHCLLAGLDDIGLTLEHEDAIYAFEKRQREDLFWLFS
jgi:3-isopropylmalate/(R)-2-methylmalate dehydratase small subunit